MRALVLGIGSSASTDGGTGMLTALGGCFQDAAGQPVAPGARGLGEIASVDVSGLRLVPEGGATVLTDVTNPLLGPRGAAAVFGPQKGLGAGDAGSVDAALRSYATRLTAILDDPARGDLDAAGAGAAGGTGFALRAWGRGSSPAPRRPRV